MTPDRGFCNAVCDRKINEYFCSTKQFLKGNHQNWSDKLFNHSVTQVINHSIIKSFR